MRAPHKRESITEAESTEVEYRLDEADANRGQVVDHDCDARGRKVRGEPVEACAWWAGGG